MRSNPKDLHSRGVAALATAGGVIAIAAFALGALVIGRFATRRQVIDGAVIKSVEIQKLIVHEQL
jgi:hypothetical protein